MKVDALGSVELSAAIKALKDAIDEHLDQLPEEYDPDDVNCNLAAHVAITKASAPKIAALIDTAISIASRL